MISTRQEALITPLPSTAHLSFLACWRCAAGAAAGPSAPDFIRIAGAAKQPPKQKHAQDQQSNPTQLSAQQKADAAQAPAAAEAGDAAAAERRSQLKGVLRQLLSRGAVGPLPDGLAGLVAGLKGLQDSSTHQQQKQQHSQDTHKETAASLVALLQQQQQKQQRTQLSKAQLLVLQRRQAQQEQRRQQQQQQEADSNAQDDSGRPGWQSDVYVPPPSRMLRVKKAGAADVWNAPPSSKTGTCCKHRHVPCHAHCTSYLCRTCSRCSLNMTGDRPVLGARQVSLDCR